MIEYYTEPNVEFFMYSTLLKIYLTDLILEAEQSSWHRKFIYLFFSVGRPLMTMGKEAECTSSFASNVLKFVFMIKRRPFWRVIGPKKDMMMLCIITFCSGIPFFYFITVNDRYNAIYIYDKTLTITLEPSRKTKTKFNACTYVHLLEKNTYNNIILHERMNENLEMKINNI